MPIVKQENTFFYFSQFAPVEGIILDFGSNSGNLLRSSGRILKQAEYTGVDVDLEALVEGEEQFPFASWIHYNRYHPCYNPEGSDVWPKLTRKYDRSYSYSVFSHFALGEILSTLNFLAKHVQDQIIFSYCDITNKRCVDWFVGQQGGPSNCETPDPNEEEIYLIDNRTTDVFYETSCRHFTSFFNPEFLVEQITNEGFECSSKNTPPGSEWWQSCMTVSL